MGKLQVEGSYEEIKDESGVLNNQIEIKFYSKLDDGLSAQLFPAQKLMT